MQKLFILFFLFISALGYSQDTLVKLLKKYNKETIPYVSAQELATKIKDAKILDARELNEYSVSHIKNALYVGYKNFDINTVKKSLPDSLQTIIVYCSIGVRSEDIGEKLKKAGYTNIYNLFGGIFEWKNNNFPVFNSEEKETENVHAYSIEWGKWLQKGIKIYD